GEQKVVFRTKVPGYDDLTVTRTYTLAPKQYHIGHSITVERSASGQKDVLPFRYQLAGGHGLPIEGTWFTGTFRNAFILTVDSSGDLWRETEDSLRISQRKGGDRVPPDQLGPGSFLQWAAVGNQYFTSAIVVSDQQEEEAKGGVGKALHKVLAWARPTLESDELRGKIRVLRALGDRQHIIVRPFDKDLDDVEFELLPAAQQMMEDRKLKGGEDVFVSYFEVAPGQRFATAVRRGQTPKPFLDDITVRVNSQVLELKPGDKVVHNYLLYNGPLKAALLAQFRGDRAVDPDLVDRYAYRLHLNTLTDYRSNNIFGRISQSIGMTTLIIQCTRLMHWLLNLLHTFVPIYGLTIILL